MNNVVLNFLPVLRCVSFTDPVKVLAPNFERINTQVPGDIIYDKLYSEHSLWAAETTKCRVGHGVRLAPVRHDRNVVEKISVVAMKHRAIINRAGQID